MTAELARQLQTALKQTALEHTALKQAVLNQAGLNQAGLKQAARGRTPSSIEGAGGVLLTADQVQSKAEAIARALAANDIASDEPVLCRIANAPLDLAALLGTWLAGGVAVPLNSAATPASVAGIRQATGARLSVRGDRVESISLQRPAPRELLRGAALIVFTSGSTGKPKGVVLAHQRLARKLEVLDRLLKFSAADIVIVPLQLSFIFGIWVSLLSILSGAHLVLMPKVTAAGLANKLAERASVLAVVPTMLRALLAQTPVPPASNLRSLLSGGESLGHQLATALSDVFPRTEIFDLYGLTETGSCDFCLPAREFAVGLGSIGRPTEEVHYRIVDADGAPAKPGAAGELLLKTPFDMLGYLDDPDLSAAAYVEGYLRTGDQARLRADGRVEIVGRLKDIISRGGNKIAPAEIDTLLMRHPQVTGALCAGMADARLGEAIGAIVTVAAGADLTPEALRHWAAQRIERFKVPDVLLIRDALPTGSTGKSSRAAVARLVLAASEENGTPHSSPAP
ncbi:MAG TPA: fatty acid--CoA ligase family protein [Hyphomicrobiaceae bacterium]|nr:fatty acid--CoA ligase family protein [Hyphomicrobiaceae bacterium]